MRNALLISLIAAWGAVVVAQSPPPAASAAPRAAAADAAAQQKAAAQKKAAATGRSGFTIVVTTPQGRTIPDVTVELIGPSDRTDTTNASGQVNFTGLQAGTYRLRFTGETVTAFEREATLRASQTLALDITLNPAPPPREIIKTVEVEPATPPPPPVGPVGSPQVLSLVDLAERELDPRAPRRESLVSCSGNTRTTLLQLNQDQPERLYDNAEVLFYVIAGEGVLSVGGQDRTLQAGGFASVPRATTFSLARRGRGNRPLVLLSVLSGEPCEEAK